MSNFETPEAQAAFYAGMTLDAFADMCDREAEHAAEVEFGQINEDPEEPRFVSLPASDEDEEAEWVSDQWDALDKAWRERVWLDEALNRL
jgi:hypothetical protein